MQGLENAEPWRIAGRSGSQSGAIPAMSRRGRWIPTIRVTQSTAVATWAASAARSRIAGDHAGARMPYLLDANAPNWTYGQTVLAVAHRSPPRALQIHPKRHAESDLRAQISDRISAVVRAQGSPRFSVVWASGRPQKRALGRQPTLIPRPHDDGVNRGTSL